MTEYKNTMLISPNTIKTMNLVNLNLDDADFAASIRVAQNIYLQDIIGSALLNDLQQLVFNAIKGQSPNINDQEHTQYKELLDDYIKEALAYKAVSEACRRFSHKLRNAGVVSNSDINMNAASSTDIKELRAEYETYFCEAVNHMIAYLKANKGSFPELDDDCPCGDKLPKLNAKYGNCGLWLGK